MKEKAIKFLETLKYDLREWSGMVIISKYICPIVVICCIISILSLAYEQSFDLKDCKKVEGSFFRFEEKAVPTIFSFGKRGKSRNSGDKIKLRIYLEGHREYFTMYDNPLWYSFLYGLKTGDILEINYLPQYDSCIKELKVNGKVAYGFMQEQNRLRDLMNKDIWLISIALSIHLIWRFKHLVV